MGFRVGVQGVWSRVWGLVLGFRVGEAENRVVVRDGGPNKASDQLTFLKTCTRHAWPAAHTHSIPQALQWPYP